MNSLINNPQEIAQIRNDFPILQTKMNGKPFIYLDSAASTQKPKVVIDAITDLYTNYYSNIHRSVYHYSQLSTERYENAREIIRKFINANRFEEIIFTSGATESLNLIAYSYARFNLQEGDEIIITEMEHHANIVPWQQLAKEKNLILKYIPINERGELVWEEYAKLLSPRTKIVSLVHISNSLGTINPVKEIFAKAKKVGVVTCLDASQSIQHTQIDVQDLDCDFLAFSGHKLYGPTGIGVLYGKFDLLDKMVPFKTGGDMIKSVTLEKTIFADLPERFEAGTQNIEGAIGLAAAVIYFQSLGIDRILEYENHLLNYATEKIMEIPEVKIIGTAEKKASIISFILEDIHPHDIGTILDKQGIAIRTGQHCTQPVMKCFGIPATARASLAFYNTEEDINVLIKGLKTVIQTFNV